MACPFKKQFASTLTIFLTAAIQCASAANDMRASTDDPYLWLENVDSDKALSWVRERNAVSAAKLEASPGFSSLQNRLLTIFNSHERIPSVVKIGKYYYNFWRDDKNVRGVWRRTSLEEYKKPNTAWETVLDLDQLALSEKENWVWHGYTV